MKIKSNSGEDTRQEIVINWLNKIFKKKWLTRKKIVWTFRQSFPLDEELDDLNPLLG